MITDLGNTAREIWHYFEEHRDVTLSQLNEGIEKPREVILMSLGWLAREGHVVLEGEKDYKIRLRR
ncbi:MAG: winged helix-turn-helix domain-containing protein [Candidatus Omnitrophota bacterium]|nr:winged helix-turn-helix domain-containing protein [Candidatus Omnitrophota bacterium]